MNIEDDAIKTAARRLRRLRLTDVGGRKENPATTVKSALQRGLGGLYNNEVVEYILSFGVRYYLEALPNLKSETGYLGNINGPGCDPDTI